MISLKNKLWSNTLFYAIVDAFNKGCSFLLLPIVSHYILPEQMGIVSNFMVILNIIMLLSGQALINALPYYYYEQNEKGRSLFISNLVYLILLCNIVLLFISIALGGIIFKYLKLSILYQIIACIVSISTLIGNINLIILRLENNIIQFAKLQIAQTMINVLSVIIMVIIYHLEAQGKIFSILLSTFSIALAHIYYLYKKKYLIACIDKSSIKTLLKFGLPLLPHSLSFWIKSGMDKIILTTYCGLTANGHYSMAVNIGAIYSIANTAFSNSYIPYLQKRLNMLTPDTEEKEKKLIVQQIYKISLGFVILTAIAIFISWFIIKYLLDTSYLPTFDYIPYVMISLLFTALYGMVVQFVYTAKKTIGLGIITLSCSIIQILLAYILVPSIGSIGICYSLIIGSLLTWLIIWRYSQTIYKMPWFN